MKKTRRDRQQDFWLWLLRPLVYLWMSLDAKRSVVRSPSVDFRRREPFVLLANHTCMFDFVHVPMRFHNVPFIIASQTLFAQQPAKFFVTQLAHVIPKSKGKSDSSTIFRIFEAVKKNYPILIFPEGDITFFGATGHIEESTMKLIKKLNLDVITCNVRGGYFSRPRWAIGKRRNRRLELVYDLAISKADLPALSIEDIGQIVHKHLAHDAIEYQRQERIPHPGRRLAEGIENILYICPECLAVNSFKSERNAFFCDHCHQSGHVDRYGFLHGFAFDNPRDWDHFQRQHQDILLASHLNTTGMLYYIHPETESHDLIGKVTLEYREGTFILSGVIQKNIPATAIETPILTIRRNFSFRYDDRHYLIKLDQGGMAFLRIAQSKY
ncbi:MAG: 1-acyl-sn-glycerol-3-phosphate acyltransferase [Candidatus Izemoplasmatales bacterium]